MHLPTLAGPRRRTRRALLAAALPAALAAVALPAAADAATVELVNSGGNGVVRFSGDAGESNNVRVSLTAAGILIEDSTPIRTLDSECRISSAGDGICPATAGHILVFTGDRNDTIQYKAPHGGFVSGGDGPDIIFGGMRQAGFGRPIEGVIYRGKDRSNDPVNDTVSYVFADRAVRVDLAGSSATPPVNPSLPNDGRPGIDLEHIDPDIEIIEGSNFDDPQLFGSDRDEIFRGLNGNDLIGTGGGNDIIDEGSAPNGADTLNAGNGTNDRIKYGTRTSGVDVSLDGLRNDGAAGEQDDVRPSVENIVGTQHGDDLAGNGSANTIEGLAGDDTINGLGGNDSLVAGAGNNTVFGGADNDVIRARNGGIDSVDCGTGTGDSVDRDQVESRVVGCENVTVGVLRLAPKAVAAEAGKTARLRLSWRHPVSWRKLRKVELRLTRDGAPVGEVTIRPRGGRTTADGAVKLVRKHTRLTHKGRTVTARLAVRLDASLAGQTLKAEVEATDTRGRRQLERDAATVRVAP